MKMIYVFFSCLLLLSCTKEKTKAAIIEPCESQCELDLEILWEKDLLADREIVLFSPEIYNNRLIVGYEDANQKIVIRAFNTSNGAESWSYTSNEEVLFQKHRFYKNYLALYYKYGDGHLIILDLTTGKEINHVISSTDVGANFSLNESDIHFTKKMGSEIVFYQINQDDMVNELMFASISIPDHNIKSTRFESLLAFEGNNGKNYFSAYNSSMKSLFIVNLSDKSTAIIENVKTKTSTSASNYSVFVDNRILLFDDSQIVLVSPFSNDIAGTVPVRYRSSRSKIPLKYAHNYSDFILNTSDTQKDIAILDFISKSVKKRYSNMGDCQQLILMDEGILVTCEGIVYLLDHNSNSWVWRSTTKIEGHINDDEWISTTPALDSETGEMFYIQGTQLVSGKWPD